MIRMLIVAVLAATAASASAQSPAPTPEQKAKAEWKVAGRKGKGFDKADTNKDGFATKDEIKAAAAAKAAKKAAKP